MRAVLEWSTIGKLVINAVLLESVNSIAYWLKLAATPDFKRLGVLRLIKVTHTVRLHD